MSVDLGASLKPVRRRIRLLLVEKHAMMLGAVASVAAVVLVILSWWWFDLGEPLVLWSVVLAGIAAGAVWGAFRKLTPFAVARAAERRLELKERLSSAVALSMSGDQMVQALLEDADQHISEIKPKEVFPHKRTREFMAFAGSLIVLLGIYYIPQIPAFQSESRRQEVVEMKRQGRTIRELAKETLKKISPKDQDSVKKIALKMEKLGRKLESGRMSRKQAMLAVKKMTKDIEDAQNRMAAKNDAQKPMSQALKDFKDASPDLAKKMLDRLAKEKAENAAAGKKDPKLDALEKRLKDMQASKGEMSDKKMQELQKELSKYMQSQSGVPMPPELANMMAQLLKNQDYQKAMEMMEALSKKLGSGQMSKSDMKSLEEQMKALSKALEGTDLDKLAKQLKKMAEQLAKMDPKEAAKMMAQAAKMGMKASDLAMLGKMGGT